MSPLHFAIMVLVILVFGANFVAVKIGLVYLQPFLLLTLRFIGVAAVLLPFLKWPRGRFGQVLGLSMTLGVVHFSLLFIGMERIDAATAAIAIQLQVPFAALLAAILFKDRIGWRRTTGMAVAFVGVAIIAGEPRFAGGLVPLLLVIGAAATFAVASIQMKRLGPDLSALVMYGWLALLSAPPLMLLSLWLEDGQMETLRTAPWQAWAAVAFQVLVTVFGHGSWYFLVRYYPISLVMPFTLVVPIIGVLSGVFILGDPLTTSMVIGGIATIVGVGIIIIHRPRAMEPATKGGL